MWFPFPTPWSHSSRSLCVVTTSVTERRKNSVGSKLQLGPCNITSRQPDERANNSSMVPLQTVEPVMTETLEDASASLYCVPSRKVYPPNRLPSFASRRSPALRYLASRNRKSHT